MVELYYDKMQNRQTNFWLLKDNFVIPLGLKNSFWKLPKLSIKNDMLILRYD